MALTTLNSCIHMNYNQPILPRHTVSASGYTTIASDANYNYFEYGSLTAVVTAGTMIFVLSPNVAIPNIEILAVGGGGRGGSNYAYAGKNGGGVVVVEWLKANNH